MFDTETKLIYDNEKISPDSLTFQLPLLSNWAYSDNKMYFIKLTAKTVLEMIASGKTKNITYPDKLEMYLKTADKNTNPVLIYYTYKN